MVLQRSKRYVPTFKIGLAGEILKIGSHRAEKCGGRKMKFSKEDLNMNRQLSTMMILLLIHLLAPCSASLVSAVHATVTRDESDPLARTFYSLNRQIPLKTRGFVTFSSIFTLLCRHSETFFVRDPIGV